MSFSQVSIPPSHAALAFRINRNSVKRVHFTLTRSYTSFSFYSSETSSLLNFSLYMW